MKKARRSQTNGKLNVLSDREYRRLAKHAASMAIAAALAASVLCAPALAVSYTIDENKNLGTVHTGTSGEDVISWQEGNTEYGSQEKPYNHTQQNDNVINITGNDSDGDGITTTDQILDVGTGTTGVTDNAGNDNEQLDINISGVTADVQPDENKNPQSAVHVGSGSKVDIEIEDSSITTHDADAIHIEGSEAVEEPTDSSPASNVTLNLNDVNITTDGQNINSIYVGDDTVGQLTLSAVQMEVNGEKGNGIEVGAGSDVDIELNESTEDAEALDVSETTGVNIELNANGTSGIAVDGANISESNEDDYDPEAKATNVDIIVNGNNHTIEKGVEWNAVYDSDVHTQVVGIVVGNEGVLDDDSSGHANVTITAGESGSALTIGGDGTSEVSTGIHVMSDASLTIDGDGTDDNNPVADELTLNIDGVANVSSSNSGKGIMNYGDVTITDGAEVNITDMHKAKNYNGATNGSTMGIHVIAGNDDQDNLTISDDAVVNITESRDKKSDGTGGNGIYVESYNNQDASNFTVDNATLNISGTDSSGIISTNVNLLLKNNAQVTIGSAAEGGKVKGYGIEYVQGSTGEEWTGPMHYCGLVEISSGAKLTVDTIGQSGIYVQGSSSNLDENKAALVIDNAQVEVKNVDVRAIDSDSVDITIQNGADVNLKDSNQGMVITSKADTGNYILIQGETTTVDIDGIKNTPGVYLYTMLNLGGPGWLKVDDQAQLKILNSSGGIGAEASHVYIQGASNVTMEGIQGNGISLTGTDVENILEIKDKDTTVSMSFGSTEEKAGTGINLQYANAKIYDDAEVTAENAATGVYMYGMTEYPAHGSTMTVENATLNLNDSAIQMADTEEDQGINLLEIRNGAKVVAGSVQRDKGDDGTIAKLVITGGTLKLKSDTADGLNATHEQQLYANEDQFIIWPTNGDVYGDEKLVNFQLTKDEAHALFETFGWVYDEETKTWSAKDYEAANIQWLNKAGGHAVDGYMCDLSKYSDDETLSVWVPAVLLEYYYGTVDGDIEKMTEDELQQLIKDGKLTLQEGSDVVIRGQSINFATLEGYTSDHLQDTGKEWYYFEYVGENGKIQRFTADTNLTPALLKGAGFDNDEGLLTKNIYGIAAPGGGGGGEETPTPTPDPEPDGPTLILTDVPTEEEIPETETPLTDAPVEEIPEEETPLADAPVIDESLEEIGEEDVPLADAPTTGDESGVFGLMAALSGMALAVMSFFDRKGRHARFGSQH